MSIHERLIAMIELKGFAVTHLMGAKGYWRHAVCDVHRWDADCTDAAGHYAHIGSYNTMTECVRRGFELVPDRDHGWYEAHANERKCDAEEAQRIQGVR